MGNRRSTITPEAARKQHGHVSDHGSVRRQIKSLRIRKIQRVADSRSFSERPLQSVHVAGDYFGTPYCRSAQMALRHFHERYEVSTENPVAIFENPELHSEEMPSILKNSSHNKSFKRH